MGCNHTLKLQDRKHFLQLFLGEVGGLGCREEFCSGRITLEVVAEGWDITLNNFKIP